MATIPKGPAGHEGEVIPSELDTETDQIIEQWDAFSRFSNSTNRLGYFLEFIESLEEYPLAAFWRVFAEAWTFSDDTWVYRSELLDQLSMTGPGEGVRYASPADQALMNSLPKRVQVFRGCSRPRIRGLSWTLDRQVALKFARGHGFIKMPDPVIVEALVPKEAIFTVFTERKESEILLDPRRLPRRLRVSTWERDAA